MMKRPLLLCAFCLMALIALRYYLEYVPPGDDPFGGRPDGTRMIVSGRVRQKDDTSFSIAVDSFQIAALLRQNDSTDQKISEQLKGKKLLCSYDASKALFYDSTVVLEGYFHPFDAATNPGEFDYAAYFHAMGYAGRLECIEVIKQESGGFLLREKLYRLRCFWKDRLYRIFPPREASVMTAILLGDRAGLDEDIRELYQSSGMIHILSISGLHITFIGMGIYKLLRRAGAPVGAASFAGGAVLVLYGVMTGLGVSVCRAIGMYLIRMLALLIGRTYDMLTALGVVAVAMALYRPAWLGHMGFLLSFGSVLGVGALLPALAGEKEGKFSRPPRYVEGVWKRRMSEWGKALKDGLRQSILAGVSVTVTILPVQLWFSYEVPVCSVLLNVLILPFMGVLMGVGLLVMLIPGTAALGAADLLILAGYEWLCRLSQRLPGTVWNPGRPKGWQIAVYYLLWAAVVWGVGRKPGRKRKAVSVLLLAAAVWTVGLPTIRGDCVTFLDVGQGDGICVQLSSGEVYLFDCGSSSRGHIGENVLLSFLKYHGIRRLDAVFLSHGDADHINGVLELLGQQDKTVDIGQIVLPFMDRALLREEFGEILQTAKTAGIPVTLICAGKEWKVGEDVFLCLHPSEQTGTEGGNAGSECFYVELGEKDTRISLLFTGDVEGMGEQELLRELQSRKLGNITVLKVAHHGSKNSTSREFLRQVCPAWAVISCGRDNRYGHPHEELLERLRERKGNLVNTALDGAVEIQVFQKGVQIRRWGR